MAKVALTLAAIIIGFMGLVALASYIVTVYLPDMSIETQVVIELAAAACIVSTAFLSALFITHHRKH
ncbi:MAG TPA: hypothetical protein VLH35_08990 [Candidatus Acidoferrales bacterium]|nr:hypothetical protein [Candidatus Acidoferrales bacterium]